MFDGFWYGIFGGLFGPALAQWFSRFKYWAIFLVVTLSVFFGILTLVAIEKGWKFVFTIGLKRALEFDSLLAISGIGLLAVLVAFVGTLSTPKKEYSSEHNEPKK